MAQIQSANNSSQKSNANSKTSVIAEGTIINGDFSTNENLRIDGTIVGNVTCAKKIVIGNKGMINGNIQAAEITINGAMKGEATSKGMIIIGSKARAEGKITAINLTIEEGAVYNGDFVIGKK